MEPTGPSQTNNIQRLLSALIRSKRKKKEVESILSIALTDAICKALGLNNLRVPISERLTFTAQWPDSQKQQSSTSDTKRNDTAQRTLISLTLTATGTARNTLFTCSTIPEFFSKMNTLPKNIGIATIMKSPQTAVYFELLHVFKDIAHNMGIAPEFALPAATALTCAVFNPVTTAQMEFSRQLSNGRQLATLPKHLMEDILKNPSRYVTAGLLPTIVRSAALEMVIEAAQNHLGISQKNAIQLSYALAFPLALWGDLNRSGMPFNMTTIRRPPVAAGTGVMAAAIVLAPGLAEAIHKLFESMMGKGN